MKIKPVFPASLKNRRHVLILVPSVPSPNISRSEKIVYETLTLASKDHTVLCVPQDKPLSVRLDEAALASKGVNIYSFPFLTRNEISNRLKTLITANPALEIIGIVGLDAIRRRLIDARLFAPDKNFFAVLDRLDVRALTQKLDISIAGGIEFPDENRHLLSCCDAVFCEAGEDAEFLRRMFCVNAHKLTDISKILATISARQKCKPGKMGIISLAPSLPAPDVRGAFKVTHKTKSSGFAGINRIILDASGNIPAWAAISRPFSSCGVLWPRLKDIFNVFPNAGMLLPALTVPKNSEDSRLLGIMLEAASLHRRGRHNEPLLIDDPPLVILRSHAFKTVGGFDARFSSPICAWTDLGLRMNQAGFRVITAEDAVISSRAPGTYRKRSGKADGSDIDLLLHKWCAEGLRIMELLVYELGGRQP